MEHIKKRPSFHFGRKRTDVDMTEGNIAKHLIQFAFPLLIGNIFQQLYNMVDTWVVGNYVGDTAFSAVGTVGPIINTLIGFFIGLSTGAGVVISQYYGAKQMDKVKDTVHTALTMTFVLGVLFTALGIIFTPFMLRIMKMPPSVAPEATSYLIIYFAGVMGLMVYNIGSGILRAVGDSKRPFYFLMVSALLNTVLDLVFVLVFHMGVEGVAYATIIAQGVSATLVIITLCRTHSVVRVSLRSLCIHFDMLKKIFRIGLPAAIQTAITAFSNVFAQSYINYFEVNHPGCMGGWTAYSKIDQLLFMPMQSLALASTTFVGQNLGIGKVDRAKRGIRIALTFSLSCSAWLMIPVIAFAPHLVTFFNSEPGVIQYGTLFLRLITPFYLLSSFNQIYAGALRGAGNSRAPMVIMLLSFVAFRQVYLFVMANYISNTIIPIAMGYPAGWLLCSILTTTYFYRVKLDKNRIVEDN